MKRRIRDAYAVLTGRAVAVHTRHVQSITVKTRMSEDGLILFPDAGHVVRGVSINLTGEHHGHHHVA